MRCYCKITRERIIDNQTIGISISRNIDRNGYWITDSSCLSLAIKLSSLGNSEVRRVGDSTGGGRGSLSCITKSTTWISTIIRCDIGFGTWRIVCTSYLHVVTKLPRIEGSSISPYIIKQWIIPWSDRWLIAREDKSCRECIQHIIDIGTVCCSDLDTIGHRISYIEWTGSFLHNMIEVIA